MLESCWKMKTGPFLRIWIRIPQRKGWVGQNVNWGEGEKCLNYVGTINHRHRRKKKKEKKKKNKS